MFQSRKNIKETSALGGYSKEENRFKQMKIYCDLAKKSLLKRYFSEKKMAA